MAAALTCFPLEWENAVETIFRQPDVALAYEYLPGRAPVVVFLPGYASDMNGTKAIFLRNACAVAGHAMLRLDYAGHGQSGGRFTDGCIGDWTEDAAAIIAAACGDKSLILVGSSMGGWVALLLALRFPAQLRAMLLIAPAPDFTEVLIRPQLTPAQQDTLDREGVLYQPSDYGPPTPITRRLFEDGRNHLLLNGPIGINCPVRILHGMKDPDVPWQHSTRLADCLETPHVRLTLIKDGDHRLSREHDLLILRDALMGFLNEYAA
jgi:pimeloyl-ACP methyl ester carboxylesterase